MSEDLLREILGKANKNDTFRQLLIQAQSPGGATDCALAPPTIAAASSAPAATQIHVLLIAPSRSRP